MKRILLAALFTLSFFAYAKATDYYVDGNNGNNTTGNGTINKPWQSISFALSQVNTSAEMQTIYVKSAMYDTTIETFPIVIKNKVSLVGEGRDVTILDAKKKDTVILCKEITDSRTKIEGFTIMGGYSRNTRSSNGWSGMAILIDNSSPTIINNRITNNIIGHYSTSAIMCDRGTATIESNVIANNGEYGIRTVNIGTQIIRNNTIEDHTKSGIYCSWSSSPTIRNNIIRDNNSGVQSDLYALPIIEGNTIYENNYGIHSEYENIKVKYNTIVFNTKDGFFLQAVTGKGPGPELVNNTINSNGENGIHLSCQYHNVSISLIKNNIISNNIEYGIKESVRPSLTTEIKSIQYNLFHNNGSGVYLYQGTDTFNDVALMDSIVEACKLNLAGDPLFVNALDINYNLLPGSPAINSGDPNSPLDLDGSRADIGALAYFDPSGPPLTPTNFRALSEHAKVTLLWSPNLEPDLSYYCIYRSLINNFVPSPSDSIGKVVKPGTIYNDIGLQIGTTYYYRICAVDSTDKRSEFTSAVAATPYFDPNFIKVLAPDNDIFVNKSPITVKGIAVTPYLEKVTVDNIAVPIVNDTFKVEIDLNEGLNEITVIGFDSSDTAVLEQKIKIKLDSNLPQVKITAPVSGQSMNYSPIQIKGRFVETNLVSLKINNIKSVISGTNFSLGSESGEGIEINEGINWIKAIAIDSAGNQGVDSVSIIGVPPTPKRLYLKSDIMSWFPYPPYPAGTTQGYSTTFIVDQKTWKFHLTGDIKGSNFTVVLLAGCYGLGSAEMKGELFLRHEGSDELLASTPQFSGLMAGYTPFGYQPPSQKWFNLSGKDPNSLKGDTLIFKVTKVGGDRAGLIFIRELNMGHSYIQTPSITKIEEKALTSLPLAFELSQNYPNPFNPETTIKYQLPEPSEVTIRIFNITGQVVKTILDEHLPAGYHSIVWDGKDDMGNHVSSGVYLYQLRARSSEENFTETRKMILVR